MNEKLFMNIEELLARYDSRFALSKAVRYMSLGRDPRERDFAAKAKVISRYSGQNVTALYVAHEGESNRWLISGPNFAPDSTSLIQLASSGEALLFLSETTLRLNSTPLECFDVVSLEPDSDYDGHDSQALTECFLPIYSVPGAAPSACKSRDLMNILISAHRVDVLIEKRTRDAYADIDYLSCSYEITKLQSLINYGTRRQFLELYNGIESLFFRTYCREFYEAAAPKLDEEDFYEKIEQKIGWRPREIDALAHIIEIVHRESAKTIEEICKILMIKHDFRASQRIADKVYKFRNDAVHWKYGRRNLLSSEEIEIYSNVCMSILRSIPQRFFSLDEECTCDGLLIIS